MMSIYGDSPESMQPSPVAASSSSCAFSAPPTPSRVAPQPGTASPYRPTMAVPDQVARLKGVSRGQQKTAQWMDSNYMATVGPGVPTSSAANSNAPSVISCTSAMSGVSLSGMSQLSICTQFTEAAVIARMTAQNDSAASSASSSVENINPQMAPNVNQVVKRISRELNTKGIEYAKAVGNLWQAVNSNYMKLAHPQVLHELFIAMAEAIKKTQDEDQTRKVLNSWLKLCRCRECLMAQDTLSNASKALIVDAICGRIDVETRYMESALSLLRFLVGRNHVREFRRFARTEATVVRLLRILSYPLQMSVKHIVLDTLRYLMSRDEVKGWFKKNGGIREVLQLLRQESDEKILFAATFLLNTILSSSNRDFANELLLSGGVAILAPHLAHGSPRFLLEVLKLLLAVTNVEGIRQANVRQAVQGVVRLLGSSEPMIVSYCIAFIFRCGAFNPPVPALQEFMIMEKTVNEVFRVLEVTLGQPQHDPRTMQGIVDNAMGILAGFMCEPNICRLTCEQIRSHPSFKFILVNLLGCQINVTRRNSAMILARIFSLDPRCVAEFLGVFDHYKGQSIAANAFTLMCEAAVRINETPDAEEARVCKEYMAICLDLLQSVVQQPEFANQVQGLVRSNNVLYCLANINYEGLEMQILSFCDRLLSPNPIHPSPTYTDDPHSLATEWAANSQIIGILERYCLHAMPNIANLARRVFDHLKMNNFARPHSVQYYEANSDWTLL